MISQWWQVLIRILFYIILKLEPVQKKITNVNSNTRAKSPYVNTNNIRSSVEKNNPKIDLRGTITQSNQPQEKTQDRMVAFKKLIDNPNPGSNSKPLKNISNNQIANVNTASLVDKLKIGGGMEKKDTISSKIEEYKKSIISYKLKVYFLLSNVSNINKISDVKRVINKNRIKIIVFYII